MQELFQPWEGRCFLTEVEKWFVEEERFAEQGRSAGKGRYVEEEEWVAFEELAVEIGSMVKEGGFCRLMAMEYHPEPRLPMPGLSKTLLIS